MAIVAQSKGPSYPIALFWLWLLVDTEGNKKKNL